MTTKAIEAGARAIRRVRLLLAGGIGSAVPSDSSYASAAIEAAIATGELVPASAVAAERERCLKEIECLRFRAAADLKSANCQGQRGADRTDALYDAYHAVKALPALEPASGECVLGWQTMDSAPKDGTDILVLVEESGEQFVCYFDGSGWRYATFPGGVMICAPDYWKKLDTPPVTAATSNGSGK